MVYVKPSRDFRLMPPTNRTSVSLCGHPCVIFFNCHPVEFTEVAFMSRMVKALTIFTSPLGFLGGVSASVTAVPFTLVFTQPSSTLFCHT